MSVGLQFIALCVGSVCIGLVLFVIVNILEKRNDRKRNQR